MHPSLYGKRDRQQEDLGESWQDQAWCFNSEGKMDELNGLAKCGKSPEPGWNYVQSLHRAGDTGERADETT